MLAFEMSAAYLTRSALGQSGSRQFESAFCAHTYLSSLLMMIQVVTLGGEATVVIC